LGAGEIIFLSGTIAFSPKTTALGLRKNPSTNFPALPTGRRRERYEYVRPGLVG